MRSLSRFIITLSLIGALSTLGTNALAQTTTLPSSSAIGSAVSNLSTTQSNALGTDQNTPLANVVAGVIQVILSIVALIFIGLIIYGGYEWGTARGNEQKVDTAKKLIFEATIGIIIIFGAYFLTAFVVQRLAIATFTQQTQSF